jgi:hypothetical protein
MDCSVLETLDNLYPTSYLLRPVFGPQGLQTLTFKMSTTHVPAVAGQP